MKSFSRFYLEKTQISVFCHLQQIAYPVSKRERDELMDKNKKKIKVQTNAFIALLKMYNNLFSDGIFKHIQKKLECTHLITFY